MIKVTVSSSNRNKFDFAEVIIEDQNNLNNCKLDLNFKDLYDRCGSSNTTALDFLFISSIIYATDKFISRKESKDKWTRNIQIMIPIYNLKKWEKVKNELNKCISFLTGDIWNFEFYKNNHSLHRPNPNRVQSVEVMPKVQADIVCLFSGGLDSLIGAINWLEENHDKKILLVGHYDGQVKGPKTDQNNLLNHLQVSNFSSRIDSLQIRVGQRPKGNETTFRSRSILFLALGIYSAASISEDTSVLIPENGTIALNIALTPSRRGSSSTRTAHPTYLEALKKILKSVGIKNQISNPLGFKTKGEAVKECKNQTILKSAILDSVSCGKSGHTKWWIRRESKGCGRCVPCIFRRAALHCINEDSESYGIDICSNEINIIKSKTDFEAVLSFISKNYSIEKMKFILLNNGVDINIIDEYASLSMRAIEEVRLFIKEKATKEIKELIK